MIENEYEVESILQARLEKKRGKPAAWKYLVKWKGYGNEDNTWEPIESFESSKGIINQFWVSTDTGERDFNVVRLFKAGEEFYPIGPPRRNRKRRASQNQDTPAAGPVKRQRNSPTSQVYASEVMHSEPTSFEQNSVSSQSCSLRNSPMTSSSTDVRTGPTQSSSDIQDSETIIMQNRLMENSDIKAAEHGGNSPERHDIFSTQTAQANQHHDDATDDLFDDPVDPTIEPDPSNKPEQTYQHHLDNASPVPSHRARAANPLIKLVDDPNLRRMDRAISAKARILQQNSPRDLPALSPVPSGSLSKPLFNQNPKGLQTRKSSLLVFQKGGLQTLKGKYSRPPANVGQNSGLTGSQEEMGSFWDEGSTNVIGTASSGIPSEGCSSAQVPTGQELLRIAGLSDEADPLPDFEEDIAIEAPATPVTQNTPALQKSLIEEDAYPKTIAASMTSVLPTSWTKPTIFGPLAFGSDISTKVPDVFNPSSNETLCLSLSSSVSVPIFFTDIHKSLSGAPSLDTLVEKGLKGPPGKFYRDQFALELLDTLRTGGSAARIVVYRGAEENQKHHFERFRLRLEVGELFVAMIGVEVLAFCSSDNSLVAQRLNMPSALFSVPGDILASRVVIENHSAYAEAAVRADDVRW